MRPPRKTTTTGVGNINKSESSAGLLVSVVRTLTSSVNDDQRELEKRRLQKGYSETANNIDALVAANEHKLTDAFRGFRQVSTRITVCRERIHNVRNCLQSCKTLLQCRREELKRYWVDSAEQRHISQLLTHIKKIENVPNDVAKLVKNKRFLKASEILLEAGIFLDGELSQVDGLISIRTQIQTKKDALFETMVNELHNLLYLRPSDELLHEISKTTNLQHFTDTQTELPSHVLEAQQLISAGLCLKANEQDYPILRDNGCAFEDPSSDLPADSNPVQLLSVIVEALGIMNKIPQGIERMKHGIQRGLTRIIRHTVEFYHDVKLQSTTISEKGDARHLTELLHLIFRQLKVVVVLHTILLGQFKRVIDTKRMNDVDIYSIVDVWRQCELSLHQLLSEYLHVKDPTNLEGAVNFSTSSLSNHFQKRKPAKLKKTTLFRFDATAHFINVSEYSKETKQQSRVNAMLSSAAPQTPLNEGQSIINGELGSNREQVYVCPPNITNITAIFKPLNKLATEIEHKIGKENSQLRGFVDQFVESHFLPTIQKELREEADAALQSATAWQSCVNNDAQRRLEATVPVLVSSEKTLNLCNRVNSLMMALPPYCERLAALWLLVMSEYLTRTQTEYEKATKSLLNTQEGEGNVIEWRKISAAWAVDEDISRLLKSLPNWTSLHLTNNNPGDKTPFSPPTAPLSPMMDTTDEIRKKNERESEILIGNLGTQKQIELHEIIDGKQDNYGRMRCLATIHESVYWFCCRARHSLAILPQNVQKKLENSEITIRNEEENRVSVEKLAEAFERHLTALEDIAATCLLMLHLEVRVHCFYHLLPVARAASQITSSGLSQDTDIHVTQLNQDLINMHNVLECALESRKVLYMFEGVGHLVACIFMHCSHQINKINDHGCKRIQRNIFVIQQCLAQLTASREPDLDTAQRFFELLYHTPDEILNGIVENGADFTEMQYTHIIALAIRSHARYSTEPGALENRLNRLRDIMNELNKAKA